VVREREIEREQHQQAPVSEAKLEGIAA